jgi:hypothetical protein
MTSTLTELLSLSIELQIINGAVLSFSFVAAEEQRLRLPTSCSYPRPQLDILLVFQVVVYNLILLNRKVGVPIHLVLQMSFGASSSSPSSSPSRPLNPTLL